MRTSNVTLCNAATLVRYANTDTRSNFSSTWPLLVPPGGILHAYFGDDGSNRLRLEVRIVTSRDEKYYMGFVKWETTITNSRNLTASPLSIFLRSPFALSCRRINTHQKLLILALVYYLVAGPSRSRLQNNVQKYFWHKCFDLIRVHDQRTLSHWKYSACGRA